MTYPLEYYLNYWGPFVIILVLMLFLFRWAGQLHKTRESQAKEMIEIHRQSLAKLSEIKTLLEDRNA